MCMCKMVGCFRWAVIAVVAAMASVTSAQTTWYVDHTASGTGNGQSWPAAFATVQQALVAADDDDVIWIAEGTYVPSEPSGRFATFEILFNLSIFGGFDGTEDFVEERDIASHPTVLSGDLAVPRDDAPNFANRDDNSYHVVTVKWTVEDMLVLDAIIVRGGNADGTAEDDGYGGGILLRGDEPDDMMLLARNFTRLEDNSADRAGGAIGAPRSDGAVELRDVVVAGNRMAGDKLGILQGGGGLNVGHLKATRCRFEGNVAVDSLGGALTAWFTASDIPSSLVNVEFVENIAGLDGGAVWTVTPIDFANCLFARNEATDEEGMGGAIYIAGGLSRVVNCTIADNLAINDVDPQGPPQAGIGGGIHLGGGSVRVRSSVLWGNRVDTGSGLADHHWAQISAYANGELATTAIAYSDVENYQDCQGACNDPLPDYHNIGFDLALHDPLFADAAGDNYSHRTFFLFNVGDNASLPEDVNDLDDDLDVQEALPLDLPFTERVKNEIVDMGAYEWCIGDLDGDGDVDGGDLGMLLAAWGPCDPEQPCLGDLDGSGEVDGADLGARLASWGTACWVEPSSLLGGATFESVAADQGFEDVFEFFEWLNTVDDATRWEVLAPLLQ